MMGETSTGDHPGGRHKNAAGSHLVPAAGAIMVSPLRFPLC